MDPDSLWQLVILLICLVLSAFFSASETALMALNKIKIRQMIDDGVPRAALVGRLLEDPQKWLSAILVGNNLVNIAASALASSIAIRIYGNIGVGIATGIMTLLVLVFAEITPKSLASAHAERFALRIARPIAALTRFLSPLVFIFSSITRGLIKILGGTPEKREPNYSEEELRTMMDVGHEEGSLEGDERRLLQNVFEFGDAQVRDVMIARIDIVAVEVNSTYDDVMSVFSKEHCSRMPVYEDSLDNIIGILHVKDIFLLDQQREVFALRNHIRRPYYTIESKRIADLFEEMRGKRTQMAVVVDEYGGTAGIVTVQDIIEVIFGDISDEYDDGADDIIQVSESEFWVAGSTRLKDINDLLRTQLVSEDFESIGGLMTGLLGRLPRKGDTIEVHNLICQVLDADRTRITRLSVKIADNEMQEP